MGYLATVRFPLCLYRNWPPVCCPNFACREAFWASRAKIRICTELLYLIKWHCRVSYSNFMASWQQHATAVMSRLDLLDQRMIEKSWRLPLLPVSLRDAEAGRRSPECHCRIWWAFWLNKRVCAARFITVWFIFFIFFPPMPAPYHSFKIRGPKGGGMLATMSYHDYFPGNFEPNFSHLARFLDQTAGLPSAHRQPLCGTGWKSRPGFKYAENEFLPPRWTDVF